MNILLIIAIVVIGLFLIKGYGLKHRLASWFLVIVIAFVVLSVIYVFKHNPVDLKSMAGIFNAFKIYFSWLVNLGGSFDKISGVVTGIDWSGNATAAAG
jgi:hypothetical protein